LYAINPEAGFFGVAPGTSLQSNPNAMASIERNTIFTNVALTPERDVWWEGMTPSPPGHLTDWQGQAWTPADGRPAAHPNGRFTAPASQCPVIDPNWEDPAGVPIEAFLFGGRRASTVPLVYQANDWDHGVFIGSSIASETTAAAVGSVGQVRRDPFAMLPFCGYHMGDYFEHWLDVGAENDADKLPKMFAVNWFRKDPGGQFLWPGYGENSRVLKWIFQRLESEVPGVQSPVGTLPAEGELDLSGLDIAPEAMSALLHIDKAAWRKEAAGIREYYAMFGQQLPPELIRQLDLLEDRLG
jgi:phosphoenolpyruvate carboxykinase (GTP)